MSAIAMVSRFIMIEPKYSKSEPAIFISVGVLRRQLLQQRLRLLQIARVEAFSEPPVNRSQQFARLLHLALVAPTKKKSWRPPLIARRKTLKISSTTGFRLPKTMLATVDAFCAKQDVTRSQIFRRSIMEFLKNQNAVATDVSPPAAPQAWPTELFER